MSLPPAMDFRNIVHEFRAPAGGGRLRVLDDISFSAEPGTFTAVIGPSGCGKSTLLQLMAGLLRPTAGSVLHGGQAVSGVNQRVGFVPQQAQLFPWKTLRENIELPLLLRGTAPAERASRVAEIIAAVGLAGFENHYPHQLSGGMQKRGSIARTLVYTPDVILMDEPFGALDAQTRMIMQNDLQAISMQRRPTVLFITHDITEAITLADTVIVLSQRPTRVLAAVPITLERPRNVFEPFRMAGYEAIYDRIWSIFRSELPDLRPASIGGAV
ncbi:ABC transporter ATP-binding protein [Ferrovibrio xuzhouensis]|uniref:ABC transporter ATP-binding protein n=1 Tax=Ferrovibrio xuzhouensis TaxID=1576914 RepID=A0ABV7VD83_9PROT